MPYPTRWCPSRSASVAWRDPRTVASVNAGERIGEASHPGPAQRALGASRFDPARGARGERRVTPEGRGRAPRPVAGLLRGDRAVVATRACGARPTLLTRAYGATRPGESLIYRIPIQAEKAGQFRSQIRVTSNGQRRPLIKTEDSSVFQDS